MGEFMYCSNCGNRNEGNNFCTRCGILLSNNNINTLGQGEDKNGLKTASIILGIIGIVGSLTILLSFVGVVVSLIGLILGIVATKKGRNVVGIVLNSVGLFLSISILLLLFIFVSFVINEYGDYEGSYYNKEDYFDNFDDYYEQYFNNGRGKEYY